MRPQPAIRERAQNVAEIDQDDEQARHRQATPNPATWRAGNLLVSPAGRVQQRLIVSGIPLAQIIVKSTAGLARSFSQRTLVGDVIVNHPFPPEGRSRIHIKEHSRPARVRL
jgi:hypothetical protein